MIHCHLRSWSQSSGFCLTLGFTEERNNETKETSSSSCLRGSTAVCFWFEYGSRENYTERQSLPLFPGYQVETKPADNAVTYAGMHAGKGDIDIHCDAWIPNQKDFHKKYVLEEKTVAYSDKHYIGSSGFCVPGYFAEEHNVKTIYDLARPEVAKLLDTDGNGKGEIWIGRTGWIATNENMIKTRDYGLLGNNEWVRVAPGAHYGALKEAIKNKKGYAGYCWKPDWVRTPSCAT